MAAVHPDLEAEQAYIDHAYECLEATREAARKIRNVVEVGRGGTLQARFEREVFWDTMVNRLAHLQLGDQALCFGRIDTVAEVGENGSNGSRRSGPGANGSTGANGAGDGLPAIGDSFYIGRIAVSDEQQEPMIVDWRAPVAEPFYRATGREPMGLVRRRHFATRGRSLLNIEDELFGDAATSLGLDRDGSGVTGHGALLSALETARSGKLGDIVATIQGEQDEIIRSDMAGVLVVQGGPGTGKTVVALHRAAYLLYTFRFPLEDQGVLVVGPNRLFLSYIDQVLPSLGEAGVELAVLADLVPDVTIRDRGRAARIKGDERMLKLLIRAVRQRERALREDLVLGFGVQYLTLTRDQSRRIVDEARRRFRRHNAGRRHVESEVYNALARSSRDDLDPGEVRERFRGSPQMREALEWMWPVLTPAQLLHDFYGSKALLRNAAKGLLDDDEWRALHRPRSGDVDSIVWTDDDAPLLDEARALLGVRSRPKRPRPADGEAPPPNDDEVHAYGHIVVDEAQDLSPMQLQMLTRRSLNGSMTIVGDIAQATGQWAHQNWEEILDHLPDRKPPHRAELTIGYRLPKPIMDLAGRVLRYAAPELDPPNSVREDGDQPRIVAAPVGALKDTLAEVVGSELAGAGLGNIAVICPGSMTDEVNGMLTDGGIEFGQATRHGLDIQVTVVPVGLVKGLEVDVSVVVEPARIVEEEVQGLRSLYVALTRATKRLVIVHEQPLPSALVD